MHEDLNSAEEKFLHLKWLKNGLKSKRNHTKVHHESKRETKQINFARFESNAAIKKDAKYTKKSIFFLRL